MQTAIGLMKESLTIQTRTSTTDTQGGRTVSWSTLDTVSAELLPISAAERLQAQALQHQINYQFRIRVRADVTAKMRVRWTPRWPNTQTAKTLEVHGVQPMNDGRQWMLLVCGEVAN